MRCLLLLLAWMLPLAAAAQAQDARAIAAAADRRYAAMKTMTAEFTELYSGLAGEREESGSLLLKRPGKMRWDYRTPKEKLFVADGKNAYFYVAGERQARHAPLKKLDDVRSPLRFLLGKVKLLDEFPSIQLAEGVRPVVAGNVVLSGVPKRMADRIARVQMEFTPAYQLVRIVIEELDGTVTEFRFGNIVENAPIADAAFRFKPPTGVELLRAEDLTE